MYVTKTGAVSFVSGVAQVGPSIPSFLNKCVLAIIYRPANQFQVYDYNITEIDPDRESPIDFAYFDGVGIGGLTAPGSGLNVAGTTTLNLLYVKNVDRALQWLRVLPLVQV